MKKAYELHGKPGKKLPIPEDAKKRGWGLVLPFELDPAWGRGGGRTWVQGFQNRGD